MPYDLTNLTGALSQDPMIDPKALGLMQAGFAGLQASGPSRMPVSLGQVIGQAGSAGIGAYQQGVKTQSDMADRKLLIAAKLEQLGLLKEASEAKKADRDFFARPDVQDMLRRGDVKGVYALMPNKSAQSLVGMAGLMQKPEGYTLPPGSSRYDAGGKLITTAPAAPEKSKKQLAELRFGGTEDNPLLRKAWVTEGSTDDPQWVGEPYKPTKQLAPTIINQGQPSPPVAVIGPDGKPTYVSRADAIGQRPFTGSEEAAGARVTGRERAEREANYPETTKQLQISNENLQNLESQLKDLKTHKGLPGITGWLFGRTPSVTSESLAAQAIYDNVINNVFVNALQSMRAASKTGGAVGNVSDKEGERLSQTLAGMSRVQSTQDLNKQINIALDRIAIAKKNINDAYRSTYEYRDAAPTPSSISDTPPPGAVRRKR